MPKPNPARTHYTFEALGTLWDIETPKILPAQLKANISRATEEFDHAYSRFRDDSLISKLAHVGGTVSFPPGNDDIFALYDRLFAATDGRVTPLIGQTLSDLGYDAAYSFAPKPTAPVPDYTKVLLYSNDTISLTQPSLLDIGAVGKGYLVDRISEIVAGQTEDFIVDGSGDIAVGITPAQIGLEHPNDQSVAIGHADIRNASLCGSAVNRRVWGDGLHHVIDPATRMPVSSILATWVIADTTMLADGLTTALFFSTPDQLLSQFSFSYVIMHADGSVNYSHDDRITLYD